MAGEATVDDVAGVVGESALAVISALQRLEQRGMVRRGEAGGRFRAAPPELAIEPLVRRRELALEEARLHAADLNDRFQSHVTAGRTAGLLEIIREPEDSSTAFLQLQEGSSSEIRIFDRPPYATPERAQQRVESAALARGVRVRCVYQRTNLEDLDTMRAVERQVLEGEEARAATSLPLKLAIGDNHIALVPLDSSADGEPVRGAALIRPCALLDALITLFEATWRHAYPVVLTPAGPAVQDGLTEDERRILTLLQAGISDRAIARRLDVAERTVGRRLQRLMDRAGVQTRFQLGYRALEEGWLTESAPDLIVEHAELREMA